VSDITGITSAKALGEDLFELMPNSSSQYEAALSTLKGEESRPEIFKYEKGPTRESIFLEFTNFPKQELNGPIEGGIVIVRDVTGHNGSEATEIGSHRLLIDIIEGSTDPIFAKDREHRYLIINSFAASQLNSTPDQLIGKSDPEILPPEILPIIFETDSRILESGETEIMEEQVADRIWLAKKWPLRDDEGQVIGLAGISKDITDRKEFETQLKKSTELSESLNRINTRILRELDFKKIIAEIGLESMSAIGCDGVAVFIQEDDGWHLESSHGIPEGAVGTLINEDEFPHIAVVKQTKEPLVFNNKVSTENISTVFREAGFCCILSVPMIIGEKVIGVISFCYIESKNFTELEFDFAKKLAVSISLALENARLYSIELNISETLQEALLVVPEKIEDLDFGHLYRSATVEAIKAGGDFYDIFELEDDHVGIIIGDVSGKGLEASALTSMAKNAVKAYSFQSRRPAQIMATANKYFCKEGYQEVFATIFFGLLNKRNGDMLYCSAGHPPPLVKRTDGEVLKLTTRSPAIGIMPDLDFRENLVRLDHGDILICYTDGVIEARHGQEFFSEEGLIDLARNLESPKPGNLPKLILNEISRYSDGRLDDDIAILTLAR